MFKYTIDLIIYDHVSTSNTTIGVIIMSKNESTIGISPCLSIQGLSTCVTGTLMTSVTTRMMILLPDLTGLNKIQSLAIKYSTNPIDGDLLVTKIISDLTITVDRSLVVNTIIELVNSGLLESDMVVSMNSIISLRVTNLEGITISINPKYRDYLVTELPVPLGLYLGSKSISIAPGVVLRYPRFTISSMIEASRRDDPKLLRSPSATLMTNGLEQLWDHGSARLQYKLEVYMDDSDTIIEGPLNSINPNLSVLDNYVNSGQVVISNETSNRLRIVVSRTKGTRVISDEEILQLCRRAGTSTVNCNLLYILNGKVVRTSLRSWLEMTMRRFESKYPSYLESMTNRYKTLIEDYEMIPKVIELLNSTSEPDRLSGLLNIDNKRLASILSKGLQLASPSVRSAKIYEFMAKIDSYSRMNSTEYCNSIIVDKL